MNQKQFIIGNREFTATMPNPLDANKILMKAKKMAIPSAMKLFASKQDIASLNAAEAIIVLADILDETAVDEIVLPFFGFCRVYAVEEKQFIKGSMDVNKLFTMENFFDFYELVYEVARFVYSPFFEAAARRFGLQQSNNSKAVETTEN